MGITSDPRSAAKFESPLRLWIEIWQREIVYARAN